MNFNLTRTSVQLSGFSPSDRKDREQGFTLIELLVVTIIIGILAAVAVPSVFSQVYKAQAAGAKVHLGSINRAQQAYRFTHDAFADSFQALETDVPVETKFHTYAITESENNWTILTATPRSGFIRGYVGITYIEGDTVQTNVCEGEAGVVPAVSFTEGAGGAVVSGCKSLR